MDNVCNNTNVTGYLVGIWLYDHNMNISWTYTPSNKKCSPGMNVSFNLHYWMFSNKHSYQTHHKTAGPSWMHTNLPFFTPRRSCTTLNRRTKLQWCMMWDWFYANDSLPCFPDVCPITVSTEAGALKPGTPSVALVMASGMPELPVTPVRTHSPVIPVTLFTHSYEMCFLNMKQKVLD